MFQQVKERGDVAAYGRHGKRREVLCRSLHFGKWILHVHKTAQQVCILNAWKWTVCFFVHASDLHAWATWVSLLSRQGRWRASTKEGPTRYHLGPCSIQACGKEDGDSAEEDCVKGRLCKVLNISFHCWSFFELCFVKAWIGTLSWGQEVEMSERLMLAHRKSCIVLTQRSTPSDDMNSNSMSSICPICLHQLPPRPLSFICSNFSAEWRHWRSASLQLPRVQGDCASRKPWQKLFLADWFVAGWHLHLQSTVFGIGQTEPTTTLCCFLDRAKLLAHRAGYDISILWYLLGLTWQEGPSTWQGIVQPTIQWEELGSWCLPQSQSLLSASDSSHHETRARFSKCRKLRT